MDGGKFHNQTMSSGPKFCKKCGDIITSPSGQCKVCGDTAIVGKGTANRFSRAGGR